MRTQVSFSGLFVLFIGGSLAGSGSGSEEALALDSACSGSCL